MQAVSKLLVRVEISPYPKCFNWTLELYDLKV